jgi:hypothetical protein
MAMYSKDDIICCPHCSKQQESPATDYVILDMQDNEHPGKSDCWSCGKWFQVTRITPGTYSVLPTEPVLDE